MNELWPPYCGAMTAGEDGVITCTRDRHGDVTQHCHGPTGFRWWPPMYRRETSHRYPRTR